MTVAARRLATPSSVNAAIKQIADVMRRANYAGALQYVPELSWILFLRILDEREELEADEADAVGVGSTRRSPRRIDGGIGRQRTGRSGPSWSMPRWARSSPS